MKFKTKRQALPKDVPVAAIQKLVDYSYRDEAKHFEESMRSRGHIFRSIHRISTWLDALPLRDTTSTKITVWTLLILIDGESVLEVHASREAAYVSLAEWVNDRIAEDGKEEEFNPYPGPRANLKALIAYCDDWFSQDIIGCDYSADIQSHTVTLGPSPKR